MRQGQRLRIGASIITALAASTLPGTSLAQSAADGPVQPFYGKIAPFYGDVGPEYGKIAPFYGKIAPFFGKIAPFFGAIDPQYGKIAPFTGGSGLWTGADPYVATTSGAASAYLGTGVDPFWGGGEGNPYLHNPSREVSFKALAGFWTTTGQSWSGIMANWSRASTTADYSALASQIKASILDPSSAFWSKAVAAGRPSVGVAVIPREDTAPATFKALATAVLGTYGIRVDSTGAVDAASLASVSQTEQAEAFLALYDNLMAYSGAPHVDWWMGQIGWSPYLAKQVSDIAARRRPISVGVLDLSTSYAGDTYAGALYQYGNHIFSDGHGAAVSSLILGSMDGSGVMGVVPSQLARVAVYDPYDSTLTTNWTDVGKGVDALSALLFGTAGSDAPVGVLNASLGVRGQTLDAGWNTALASGSAHGHVLVVAAGNDGATQTTSIPWNFAVNPSLLVVGSVGLDGTISNFSNRPGDACLIDTATGACTPLKTHFIVAPGEMILVSDGQGGTTRQSGTSLAAPLVSGAVVLLQARWPWLAWHPNALVDIITRSATPLGTTPGADPVYGVGELNIAASQSPLNWNALQYYTVDSQHPQIGKGDGTPISLSQVTTLINSGSQAVWNSSKLYITAVEPIDDTARDFKIPLATTLVGQRVADHAGLPVLQSFLSTALINWAKTGGQAPGLAPRAFAAGTGTVSDVGQVAGYAVRLSMAPAPASASYGFRETGNPVATDLSLVGTRAAFRTGYGDNPAALGLSEAFSSADGFDRGRSAADPFLRLAAGGAYGRVELNALPRTTFSATVTETRLARDTEVFGPAVQVSGAAVYAAHASSLAVAYAVSGHASLRLTLTDLAEDKALLGIQSLTPDVLGRGAETRALGLEVHADLAKSLSVHGEFTAGRTTTRAGQALQSGGDGLISTAAAVSVVRSDLMVPGDAVKLTLSQPMHIASGQITFNSYGVVDRETGAMGLIAQDATPRLTAPFAAELDYGRRLAPGREVGAFLRYETQTPVPGGLLVPSTLVGVKLHARY